MTAVDRPLIKYKWSISVPNEAAGIQQKWTGEANAWDMQNATEVILGVANAGELFLLAGLDPAVITANTKPELPEVMLLSFTEAGRVVSLCIRPHEAS